MRSGGRALDGLGVHWATKPNQTPNTTFSYPESEKTGEKLRFQEGNSPDHPLRSQMKTKCC